MSHASDSHGRRVRARIEPAMDYREIQRPETQPGLQALYQRLERALAEAVQVSRELSAVYTPGTLGRDWHRDEADDMDGFARGWRDLMRTDHPEWYSSEPAE